MQRNLANSARYRRYLPRPSFQSFTKECQMISETQDLVCQGISIPQWFAVWTAPRHEKRVSERMTDRSIEFYLPVYTTERQETEHAPITLELPLFPGYVFVRIPRNAGGKALATRGVYSIVGKGKQ